MSYADEKRATHLAILRRTREKFQRREDWTPEQKASSAQFFDELIASIDRGADPVGALAGDTRPRDSSYAPEPEQREIEF